MRNIVRLGGLFLGSALLAFVLVLPKTASSQTRSIAGAACPAESAGENFPGLWIYTCPLYTDSTTYTVPALSGAWFDFACVSSNQTVVYKLKKISWSGSATFEHLEHQCTGVSHESKWLSAGRILENADTWDHVYADVWYVGAPQDPGQSAGLTFYGITACFSGGANDCL